VPQQIGTDILLENFVFDLKWIVFLIYVDSCCGKRRKTEGTRTTKFDRRTDAPRHRATSHRATTSPTNLKIWIPNLFGIKLGTNHDGDDDSNIRASPVPCMFMIYKNATVDVRPFYSKQTQD
jgi:hypothetical protein